MELPPSRYVHGTEPEEQRRLGILNTILNEGSLREMALRGGERVVDFASGLGQLTRAMARAGGSTCRAVGIERSPEQIETARRLAEEAGELERVEFRQGDIYDPPLRPDEWGSFDVAHAALPGIEAVWRAYIETYVRAGNDPYVGRKLVSLLHEAGAAPRRSTWIWFGGSAGMPMFSDLIENLGGVLEGARHEIVVGGRVTGEAFDDAMAEYRGWGSRPDAAIWFAMAWAEGIKQA